MGAGYTAENSEFVLQANRVETAGVQEVGGARISVDIIGLDLQRDRLGIIVDLTVIGHRNNACFERGMRSCDGLLKVGCEGGDPAAAGQ